MTFPESTLKALSLFQGPDPFRPDRKPEIFVQVTDGLTGLAITTDGCSLLAVPFELEDFQVDGLYTLDPATGGLTPTSSQLPLKRVFDLAKNPSNIPAQLDPVLLLRFKQAANLLGSTNSFFKIHHNGPTGNSTVAFLNSKAFGLLAPYVDWIKHEPAPNLLGWLPQENNHD